MLKTIMKVQKILMIMKETFTKSVVKRVSNNEGLATIEVILLIIIIAGILVISAVALKASFATWMATFDTIIDSKIDAVK